ncbi:MAG: hypothetical protein JW747_08695 [Candidatus Aminicenantes bacterium]|nr:hypothetical protein [Candidatus Aminicenantes bacterium]
MKKRIVFLSLAVLVATGAARAEIIRGLGAGFGGIAALGEMGRHLRPGLSGCLIVMGPRLGVPLELTLGLSRHQKRETENTQLTLLPVFLSTRIDFKSSASGGTARPFLRFGLGGVFGWAKSFRHWREENFDPGFLLGFGWRAGLGPKMSLGLEAGYLFALQTLQPGAEHNGHFLMLGLGVDWLFTP